MTAAPRIYVALDYAAAADAQATMARLDPALCGLKVGKELFTAAGPALVDGAVRRGFAVFLDLKYHDIPNTVGGACRAAAALGVAIVNVHALGGRTMMQAAREGVGNAAGRPAVIAVTILTSHSEADVAEIGLAGSTLDNAVRLACLTQSSGLDGVVCSGREAAAIRAACGAGFMLVTPGIRPATAAADDQTRVLTPLQAVREGADILVIGRPITKAADPVAALRAIHAELEGA